MASSSSSSKLSSVSFSELSTIHVHIDGGIAKQLVKDIVESLNSEGFTSKLTLIKKTISGPQREDYEKTYESHTPGTGEREHLNYFSTTRLTMDNVSRGKLSQVLESLSEQQGIVIEVEQVIGKGGQNIIWSDVAPQAFHSSDVGFHRAPTLPVEIHYSCDIPKETAWRDAPPIELDTLRDICLELGIRIGGWFLFDDEEDETWAYRSNMFAEGESKERVQKQRDALEHYLNKLGNNLGFKCSVNALVERSLGVWKTPLTKVGQFKNVHELAKWEENFPNLKKFWVIAPNFLGDINEEFRQAMVRNFRRDAEYTYFLRSFADVQRLRHFAKSLSETENLPFVFDNIKAVLLNKELSEEHASMSIFHGEYFIANPPNLSIHQSLWPNTQGYKLRRSREKEIIGGRTMIDSEIEHIIEILQPLIDSEIQGIRLPIDSDDSERPITRAVLYTDLSGSTKLQEKLGDDAWAQVLLAYDFIVANEVSKLGGEVIKNLGDGYLLIFDEAVVALRCAQRLQLALHEHNSEVAAGKAFHFIPHQKIALDFGPVSRVMRAQGFDLSGKTLSRCARLIEQANGGQVLMLDSFREMARAAAHNWISKKTDFLRTIEFKGLEGTYELWEFRWESGWSA
ncbi:MAG TPA: adenylate/guanylate cyclase domain-containing protein [Pyrinomonadaceae bacterium]|nr:adenylate/guanylate cyclase domain-containing protein [Pyrinomonadaceae bacterium]